MKNLLRILFFLVIVRPLILFVMGVNVFGRENLPLNKQFILVSNHNSHLDALALMNLFPLKQLKHVHPVAASDYFMKNPFISWFSTTFLNIVPIPRSGFTKTNNPLTCMGEILSKGDSLIIFPEGTRGKPEIMASFKSGIAHLIGKYPSVPVLPIFMKGMGKSLPRGEMILVPFYCDVIIGQPQYFFGTKEEIVKQVEEAVINLRKKFD